MNDRPDPTDKQILTFEAKTWRYSGAKERAIGETFGLGAVAYYQRLVDILRDPVPELALEFGPLINRRRRQIAAARQGQRRAG